MKTFKFSSSLMLFVLLVGLLSACSDITISANDDDTTTPSVSPSASPSVSPDAIPTVTPNGSPSVSPSVSPTITITPTISPSQVAEDRKVTICHATGSQTNPYVLISIDENAVDAHKNNHDGDIIPAPADGCPTTAMTSPSVSPSVSPDVSPSVSPSLTPGLLAENKKVTICHATGSQTNPYVLISIDEDAVDAHKNNHDGDIIPAPTDGCPTAQTGLEPTKTATPHTPKPTSTAKGNNGNQGGGNSGNSNNKGNQGNGNNGNQGNQGGGNNGNQGGGNKGGGNK